jgi:hypothetical protein
VAFTHSDRGLPAPGSTVKVPISFRKIMQVLVAVVVCLTVAHLAGQYYRHFIGDDPLWLKLAKKFDLNQEEYSVPTWYQTVMLFSCFQLLVINAAVASVEANRYAGYWAVLAFIYLYLSADEFLQIHERMEALRSVFQTSGAFYYTWVIPYGIFVLVVALAYLKFLFHLPDRTRSLFIAAGVLYVGGALGMEMVAGLFVDSHLNKLAAEGTFTTAVLIAIEELLEMLGIVVFIKGLLSYLTLHVETNEVTTSRQQIGTSVYRVAETSRKP